MSPLALLYILFASSPLLNNWHHESTFPSTWNAMPFEHESFEHYSPSNWWGREESSTYTPEHLNWLLRKAVRSTEERYPTSIRSIVAEMTGRRFFNNEEPRMFEQTESVRPIVHLIRRIAEVNPIMIEKILSCPITRRYVEKVLRNVEPETLRMVEKMIRKNVPVNIREKVVRRVLKNLLTKSSSVFGRRSILSEMYPTESIFEESTFNTRRHHSEEPIRRMIEKLFSTRRYSKEEPMRRMIEKLFSTRRHFNVESVLRREVSPVEELFNTRRHSSEEVEEPMRRMVEELLSTRRHSEVSPVEELFSTRRHHDEERRTPSVWAIRRMLEKSTRRHFSEESRRSACPETRMIKKIVKIVKNIRENRNTERNTEMPEEFFCNYVCESNTHMRREISNMCEKVCRNYESSWESPIFGKHFGAEKINKLIKKLTKEQF